MAFRTFKEWKQVHEGKNRSQGSETDCPHPEDPEFCRQWNLYIRGELKTAPVYKSKTVLGHWEGRRGGETPTAKSMVRQKQRQGEGRHKWRDRGDY
jgi:hypothetical protein